MRILFNLLPGLVNIISGLFMFISARRMAEIGANSFMIAATMTVWAFFYALTAFCLGRFQTKRNAVKILLAGQTVLLISLTGLALTTNAAMQYIWLCGTGIGTSSFFTAFQAVVNLFGKQEYELESVAKNTAVYTLSWSFGLASGPLLAAFVWGLFDPKEGWRYCYFITIGMVLFNIVCLLLMNRFVKARLRELGEDQATAAPPEIPPEQAKLPDLIIASWGAGIFSGCIVAMMRTYIPDYCTNTLHWDTYRQGIILALFSYAQAFTGLACWKARRWQYRPWMYLFACGCGAAALLLFVLVPSWPVYLAGACLLGFFYGIYYFTFTFHALINPLKSARYAAGNETIVGMTSTFAPILAGLLAMQCGAKFPFWLGVGLALAAGLFFFWKVRQAQRNSAKK